MKKTMLFVTMVAVLFGSCGWSTQKQLAVKKWEFEVAKVDAGVARVRADSSRSAGLGSALNRRPFPNEVYVPTDDGGEYYSRTVDPVKMMQAEADLREAEGEKAKDRSHANYWNMRADLLRGDGTGLGKGEYWKIVDGGEMLKVGIRNLYPHKARVRSDIFTGSLEVPAHGLLEHSKLWLAPGRYVLYVEIFDGSRVLESFSSDVHVTSIVETGRGGSFIDGKPFATIWRIRE